MLSAIATAFSLMLSTATKVMETQDSLSETLLGMIADLIIDSPVFALKYLDALLKGRTQLY